MLVSCTVIVVFNFENQRINMMSVQEKASYDERPGVLQEYFLGDKRRKKDSVCFQRLTNEEKSSEVY
ncbi:MAG: hypothetical protein PUB18_03410 [bacterium]|nr:hypothetical protein [bacterium]